MWIVNNRADTRRAVATAVLRVSLTARETSAFVRSGRGGGGGGREEDTADGHKSPEEPGD